jgi:hypothetical protein
LTPFVPSEVQGGALAQGHADQPLGQSCIAGVMGKQLAAIRTRDPRQPGQVIAVYPLISTAHASMLSPELFIPFQTADC